MTTESNLVENRALRHALAARVLPDFLTTHQTRS